MQIGGVSVSMLADAYGTPLLAIDGERLDAAIARFTRIQRELGIEVSYAGKALLVIALARRIASAGLGIDVCSLGELMTAEAAHVPPDKLTLHGCGKTGDELRAACAGRVGRIVVDGLDEVGRLAALAREMGCAADVLVRVNTGLEAHTHSYVRTGGEDSKFGVPFESLDTVLAAVAAEPALRLAGVHTHIGSQIFDASAFVENVPLALDAYATLLRYAPHARTIILGGGFGVDPHPGGERFDTDGVLAQVAATMRDRARERALPNPALGIEPGRAIVAEAGTSVYRVVAVKQNGSRRFAIVDGGLADNPRPALYGAFHHPELANRRSERSMTTFSICGRSCESDALVEASLPGDLAAGDVLTLATTGAYTYSMASNYNRFGKPAIALAERGVHRLIVRRERDEDVLANDVVD
jgi:diaminopimelate decarboxylase